LRSADEAARAARVVNDPHYIAKALEIEALAKNSLGLSDSAEVSVRTALETIRGRGYVQVKPRLDWLLARVLMQRGAYEDSRSLLAEAEDTLMGTGDSEDLWGVQIEAHLLDSRNRDPHPSIDRIREILRKSETKELMIICVPAALAIAEILHDHRMDPGEFRSILIEGLERAERLGMRELGWQLSYRIGGLASLLGDQRERQTRYTHALRLLREIAAGLSDAHLKAYLSARHVASAILEMESLS
jgi:hypothetical protein